MLALVAEILRNRSCRVGGLDALHSGAVGGCDDQHGLRTGPGIELPVQEFADLPASFADQGDHDHIGAAVARDLGQDRRLSDTWFTKNADPLPAPAGQKAVDGTDAELNGLADQGAAERQRRRGADGIARLDIRGRPRQRIEGIAECADGAPEQTWPYAHAKLISRGDHLSQPGKAGELADRRQHGKPVGEADNLRHDPPAAGAVAEIAQFADPDVGEGCVNDHAEHPADAAAGPARGNTAHGPAEALHDPAQVIGGDGWRAHCAAGARPMA